CQRDGGAGEGEWTANAELLDDERSNFGVRQQRCTEISVKHAGYPLDVPDPGGLVQPELVPERVERLRCGGRTEDNSGNITGENVDHHEHNDRGDKQANE